jgi:hypothetical protein
MFWFIKNYIENLDLALKRLGCQNDKHLKVKTIPNYLLMREDIFFWNPEIPLTSEVLWIRNYLFRTRHRKRFGSCLKQHCCQ